MFMPLLLSLLVACGSSESPAELDSTPPTLSDHTPAEAVDEALMAPTTWLLMRGSVTIEAHASEATYSATASLYNGGIRTGHPDQLTNATGSTQIVHETWRSQEHPPLAAALASGPFTASPPYLPLQLTQADDGMVMAWQHPSGERQIHLSAAVTHGISTHTVTLGPLSLGEAVTPRERRELARAIGQSSVDDITLTATLTLGPQAAAPGAQPRVPGTLPTGDGDNRPLWEEFPSSSRTQGGSRQQAIGPYQRTYDAGEITLSPEQVDANGR